MLEFSQGQLVIIGLVLLLPIIPNLWAIWHILHRGFTASSEKLLWLMLAVFLPVLGGILYAFLGRKKGSRSL